MMIIIMMIVIIVMMIMIIILIKLIIIIVLLSVLPAPLISKSTPRYPTAAHTTVRLLFHRPIALTLLMSVNVDIMGGWGHSDMDHK